MYSHNLPAQLTTFIGREHEIAEARRLLASARLLTLTGPGGSGKTRLVFAVAEAVLEEFPDGVWVVELAPLSDPALIPQAIASVLGVRETPGQPWLETLAAFLKSRQLLLVLDNCEHLIEACARLAYALLTACPDLRLLATSREPLHIAGEVTWLVPGLALPSLQQLPPPEQLDQVEAVRLFLDRARRVFPAFTLTEQNGSSVAQICCRLGGIPLAIELAAARLRVLSPEQIAGRLDDVSRLLVSSDRTAPLRHQTLQAALDWSYALLQEPEQVLFRRLAVFAGEASLEAVERVCADDGEDTLLAPAGIPQAAILDLLAQLVDKSLVTVEREQGEPQRYRLLEPVRQYALRKLQEAGEETVLRDRHLAWSLALAERIELEILQAQMKNAVERLEKEYSNMRSAFDWSLADQDRIPQGYRLAKALTQFWQLKGYFSEGTERLERLFSSHAEVPKSLRQEALGSAGFLAIHTGDLERAQRFMLETRALQEEAGDVNGAALSTERLGWIAMIRGDYAEATRLGEESVKVHREYQDGWGEASALLLLGDLAFLQGDVHQARAQYELSLSICRSKGIVMAALRRLTRLGQASLALHDYERAWSYFLESLRLSRETGDQWGLAMGLAGLAGLARVLKQHQLAAELLGATQSLLNAFGTHLWVLDRQEYERNQTAVQKLLGKEAYAAAWAKGLELGAARLGQVVEYGLSELDLSSLEKSDALEEPGRAPLTPLQAAKGEFGGLTRREREVAILIAQGKSNAEIAAALFVGVRTVEAHVTHILNRLGFSSRTQIAGWAVEKGLVGASPAQSNPVK